MPRMRKAIPKGETHNYYGDSARRIEIRALRDHGSIIMAFSKDVPRDGVCINGSFLYTTQYNPSEAVLTKTEEYVDGSRSLDARFFAIGFS